MINVRAHDSDWCLCVVFVELWQIKVIDKVHQNLRTFEAQLWLVCSSKCVHLLCEVFGGHCCLLSCVIAWQQIMHEDSALLFLLL